MPYVTLKVSLKIKHFVRQSLFFSLVLGGIGLPVTQARSEILPDIEAHQFKIMPLEKSRTGRVYRFKVDAEQLPKPGAILLIEENDKPTMAFRVLNTDFDRSEFVAKRVRRYDPPGELKLNERYKTFEKIGDLVTPPPPEGGLYDPTAKPMLDPNPGKDLINPNAQPAPVPTLDPFVPGTGTPPTTVIPATPATPPPATMDAAAAATSAASPEPAPAKKALDVEKYDDDLDSSTSPRNLKEDAGIEKTPKVDSEGNDDEALDLDLEVKEHKIINPYDHVLGVSFGAYKDLTNSSLGNDNAGGFSIYYSNITDRALFFRGKVPQDSLSLEYGISYYSLDNVNGHNDDYTLLPIRIDLRYDLHLNETFSPFFYVGAQFNWVVGNAAANPATIDIDQRTYSKLNGFGPNIGVGTFYNIGPQWYLRADLGLDRMTVGLAVKW
jgi:hypothetical protein